MTPILTAGAFDIITHSASQTFRLGERLGRLLQAGDVVCLQGDLGSGKTCLTQGIAAGLGVSGAVSSPTFVLINEHQSRDKGPRLYHVDLYRIENSSQAFALGLDDYIYGDGITVIEWAERAKDIMPTERLWITLSYMDYSKRSLLFEAAGPRYQELLAALRSELYPRKA